MGCVEPFLDVVPRCQVFDLCEERHATGDQFLAITHDGDLLSHVGKRRRTSPVSVLDHLAAAAIVGAACASVTVSRTSASRSCRMSLRDISSVNSPRSSKRCRADEINTCGCDTAGISRKTKA